MEKYEINKKYTNDDSVALSLFYYRSIKKLFEEVITPILTSYDNVSYIGIYENENETECKIMYDIGYDNISLCYRIAKSAGSTSNMNVYIGLCKKSDTDNFNYIMQQSSSLNLATGTFNLEFRVISNNNILKYIDKITKSNDSVSNNTFFVFDVDNFGQKFILCGDGNPTMDSFSRKVYFDNDDSYTSGSFSSSSATNEIEGYVYMQSLFLTYNGKLKGLSTNIKIIKNSSIVSTDTQTPTFTCIEVGGVKYRQIFNYYWVIDE